MRVETMSLMAARTLAHCVGVLVAACVADPESVDDDVATDSPTTATLTRRPLTPATPPTPGRRLEGGARNCWGDHEFLGYGDEMDRGGTPGTMPPGLVPFE